MFCNIQTRVGFNIFCPRKEGKQKMKHAKLVLLWFRASEYTNKWSAVEFNPFAYYCATSTHPPSSPDSMNKNRGEGKSRKSFSFNVIVCDICTRNDVQDIQWWYIFICFCYTTNSANLFPLLPFNFRSC